MRFEDSRSPAPRALLLLTITWLVLANCAAAQEGGGATIHLESKQVLVPAMPYAKLSQPAPDSHWLDPEGRSILAGLTAKDFHLFQDGAEQTIDSVTYGAWPNRSVADNVGCYLEQFTAPGVRWRGGDFPPHQCPTLGEPGQFYLIAYTPPATRAGSCHKINITVDRPDSVVYGREAYCNTPNSSSIDRLAGTKFGEEMEAKLRSAGEGMLPLSMQVGYFYVSPQTTRVHISLDFAPSSLKLSMENGRIWADLSVLGIATCAGQQFPERFSDSNEFGLDATQGRRAGSKSKISPRLLKVVMQHYEKQIYLSPGDCELGVIFGDGTDYGRTSSSLRLAPYDGKRIGISSIVLGDRFHDAIAKPAAGGANVLDAEFSPLSADGLELTPKGTVRFKKGQEIAAYFEVYEPPRDGMPKAKAEIRMRILGVKTQEAGETLGPFAATGVDAGWAAVIRMVRKLPTNKLKKGSYRLEVVAEDPESKNTATREAEFTVE